MSQPRNSRYHDTRCMKKRQSITDDILDKAVPRGHPFKFFRIGQDLCWCGKTKAEHKVAT